MSTIHNPIPPTPYVASTLTDAECFRLHGTLTPERIERAITLREDFEAAVDACTGHLNEAEDTLPHEDFADDVIYGLTRMCEDDDEEFNLSPAALRKLEELIEELRAVQAAVFKGTETTARHLRSIDDALAPWVGD
jgi:hypothetical protein